ncbi:unnamed protein product, partial [Durusdinium trenchii]
ATSAHHRLGGWRTRVRIMQAEKTLPDATVTFGNTKLARAQAHVHDIHADNMMRQQHRAMTGSIYGHPTDLGASTVALRASRQGLSAPLMAAGGVLANAPRRAVPPSAD